MIARTGDPLTAVMRPSTHTPHPSCTPDPVSAGHARHDASHCSAGPATANAQPSHTGPSRPRPEPLPPCAPATSPTVTAPYDNQQRDVATQAHNAPRAHLRTVAVYAERRAGRSDGADVNRLRSYRRLERMSVERLAGILCMERQEVAGIESGRAPSRKCDMSRLGYSQARFAVTDMTGPAHRQSGSAPVWAQRQAQELLRVAGEAAAGLTRRNSGRLERLGPARSYDEGAEIGADTRVVLGFAGNAPAQDLAHAVEQLGVVLVPLPASGEVESMSSWVDDVAVVGVSVAAVAADARLLVAHEIGHLVLHTRGGDCAEDEAERFAAALLMPDEAFYEATSAGVTVRRLAEIETAWGVPAQVLARRAQMAGLVDAQRVSRLQKSLKGRSGQPVGSAAGIVPVRGRRLESLICEAGGPGACAQRLGLAEKHLRAVTAWRSLVAV